jgi:hypothetical protein
MDREQVRRQALAWTGWYSPLGHLAVTSISGLVPMALGVVLVARSGGLRWWHLAFAAGVFVLNNATEWRAHRDMLHRRFRPFGVLYDRHTPIHHAIFVTDDMAMRERREFRLVLMPAYGLFAVFLAVLPFLLLLWWLGQPTLAGLFMIVCMGYVVTYEWLHLAYHLPSESFFGRRWLVRVLRRQHAIHHDPTLMQRWNFNVTLPLWDWVRGTLHPAEGRLAARGETRSVSDP